MSCCICSPSRALKSISSSGSPVVVSTLLALPFSWGISFLYALASTFIFCISPYNSAGFLPSQQYSQYLTSLNIWFLQIPLIKNQWSICRAATWLPVTSKLISLILFRQYSPRYLSQYRKQFRINPSALKYFCTKSRLKLWRWQKNFFILWMVRASYSIQGLLKPLRNSSDPSTRCRADLVGERLMELAGILALFREALEIKTMIQEEVQSFMNRMKQFTMFFKQFFADF